MNINITEYETFYNQLQPTFEAANRCIDANPCSSLAENIDEIIGGISNSLTELEWDDDTREKYNLALETGIKNLASIKSSINATWKRSENLYSIILTKLEELNNKIDKLKEKLNAKPNYNDIKYKISGTDNIDYSRYYGDCNTWERQCNSLNSDCSSLKDYINYLIDELKRLNSKTVVEVTPIDSLSGGQAVNPKGYCIVIDVGHGGTDPGANCIATTGIIERDKNLEYGLALTEELRARGFDVTITREDNDTTLDKDTRTQLMNSAYQDNPNVIVISCHMNASPQHTASGTEIYYPIDESRNGQQLAESILTHIGEETSLSTDRGIKTRSSTNNPNSDYYFMIRRTAPNTSLLIEFGFIDNPEDAAIINNEQDEIIQAVANGICDFVDSV